MELGKSLETSRLYRVQKNESTNEPFIKKKSENRPKIFRNGKNGFLETDRG